MSDFVDTQSNFPRDYGTSDWNVIKANLPRRRWGVDLIRVEDRVPPKSPIETKAEARTHRKRACMVLCATLAAPGIAWLVYPPAAIGMLAVLILGIVMALKIEA